MKLFTNLPRTLRVVFGSLQFLTALAGVGWVLILTFHTWVPAKLTDRPKLMISMGHIALPAETATAIGLRSDSAGAGALDLKSLRGTLQVDFLSRDAALGSAVRWTMFPVIAASTAFAWVLFGALRKICGNIGGGESFSEANLRAVRLIGVTLIVYSLVAVGLQAWASHLLGSYFHQHVVVSGFSSLVPFPGSGLRFQLPAGLISNQGALVIGAVVLVLTEAFRQGLALKTDAELTV